MTTNQPRIGYDVKQTRDGKSFVYDHYMLPDLEYLTERIQNREEGSPGCCWQRLSIVRWPKARTTLAESVFERVEQYAGMHVEEELHGRLVPAHLRPCYLE